MKTELQAKYLQHLLSKKKGNEGFTLIELLVVIIIIGILAAIALPSFLNQANKARESEAKTYVGSLNRGQQAYFLENNEFATDIDTLGIGIAATTTQYNYVSAGQTGTSATGATSSATAQKAGVRNYSGLVYITGAGNARTSLARLCTGILVPTTSCT